MVRRVIAGALTIFLVAFIVYRSSAQQQLLLGTQQPIYFGGPLNGGTPSPTPTTTPTPTPTPPPGPTPNATPGVNLETLISGSPTNSTFYLGPGIYRYASDNSDRNPLNPLTGQSFIGSGAVNSTTIPSTSTGMAILDGGLLLSTWTHVTSPTNLWYHTVGAQNWNANSTNILYNCNKPPYNISGAAYPLWQHQTAYAANANIIDSNGNTENVTGAGTTGASPPTWPTVVGNTVLDSGVTWKVTAVAWDKGGVGADGCSYPQDLFVNDVVRRHSIVWPPSPGSWYFDGDENRGGAPAGFTIYLADDPTSNPTGQVIEFTVISQAVVAANANVTFQNVAFKYFATPNQRGAVEFDATNDQLLNSYIAHNHGEGVKPRNQSPGAHADQIEYNYVGENGESGLNDGGCTNCDFGHNLVERNNEDDIGYGEEAGATKWAGDTGVTVHDNEIRYNNGNGLWQDDYSSGVSWLRNNVHDNLGEGARFEHSGDPGAVSIMQDNTLTHDTQYNANACVAAHVPRDFYGAGDCCIGPQTASGACNSGACTNVHGDWEIDINNATSLLVGANGHPNTIISKCAGIIDSEGNRTLNYKNVIAYNSITMNTGSASPIRAAAGFSPSPDLLMFTPAQSCSGSGTALPLGGSNLPTVCCTGNQTGPTCTPDIFDHNSYIFDAVGGYNGSTGLPFHGQSSPYGSTNATTADTWANWQASGQDLNGSKSP